MIKAFFSSVASRNENDYLTLRRLNYLFITVYHLLSLSPHLWPLDFSQWLYKFLFHLKASEHLFSSWVDLSIFFFTRLSTGYFHASFSPIIFLTSVLAYTKNSSKEFQHWWLNSVQYYLVEKEWLIGRKLILITEVRGVEFLVEFTITRQNNSKIPWFWSHASTRRRQLVDDVLTKRKILFHFL